MRDHLLLCDGQGRVGNDHELQHAQPLCVTILRIHVRGIHEFG